MNFERGTPTALDGRGPLLYIMGGGQAALSWRRSMNDGFICSDIWGAAALSYAGYPVYRVELLNRSATAWHFDCASEDAKIILDDYNNGRLTLSDARAYSKAFSMLNAQQNDMRRSGRSSWVSADWVAGRVGK